MSAGENQPKSILKKEQVIDLNDGGGDYESETQPSPEKDFDFIQDLNADFFSLANKTIHLLSDDNKMDLANEVKKYVTILFELHSKYVDEMKEKEGMIPKLIEADEKLNMALKMTGDSQKAMNVMKLELEYAWENADASRVREQNLEDQLREMVIKCNTFTEKQEQDDGAELGNLTKYKHIILRERDRLQGENIELQRRLKMDRVYREMVDKQREDVQERVDKVMKQLDAIQTEKINSEKRLRKCKDDNDEAKDVNKSLMMKNETMERQISELQLIIQKKTAEYEKMRNDFEKSKADNTLLNKQIQKCSASLHYVTQDKKTLLEQFKDLKNDFKLKSAQASQLSKKLKKCEDDFANSTATISKLNKTIHNLKEDIIKLKNTNNNLDKTLLEFTGKYDNLKRLKDTVTHERDSLRTDIMKAGNQINDLKHKNKMRENEIDNLKLKIQRQLIKLDDAKRTVGQVIKEKEEQTQEIQLLNDKIENYKEQLQLKVDQVFDLNEQLAQKQSAYVKIQKLLETTNSERLMLQRSFQSCCEERSNLKALLSKANYQITQLTEEITSNQNKINSLNLQIEHLRSEKQDVETELRSTKLVLKNTRQELKETKQKNNSLQKTISEDEMRFLKLSIQLDDVRKEKNLIGLQMVRRNDEIILLKEKLSIFQGALDRGQVQYNQRIEDIRLLKLEISDLQTQRDVLSRGISSTADMREEVIRLQRSLNQEKVRCRVLSEDLNTPANVHRWRLLSGTDPDRFQLIGKVQVLQKRILKQQIDGIRREQILQESHKLYLSVKTYIEKLPTYKTKEDLVQSQRSLRVKDKKMKALAAELNTKEIDVKARDCIINGLKKSISSNKKILYDQRKRFAKLKENFSVKCQNTTNGESTFKKSHLVSK